MDVVREVTEFVKGKLRHHKKQWWPHPRWSRWVEKQEAESVLCFRAF
jgi:hypothetical protein